MSDIRKRSAASLANQAWDSLPIAFIGISASFVALVGIVIWRESQTSIAQLWANAIFIFVIAIILLLVWNTTADWLQAILELERRKSQDEKEDGK